MISCGFWRISNEETKKIDVSFGSSLKLFEASIEDVTLLFNEYAMTACWNKLFKREIIMKNNIRFDLNSKIGEDVLFNFKYLNYAKEIRFNHTPLYNYNVFRARGSRSFYKIDTKISIFEAKKNIIVKLFKDEQAIRFLAHYALREIQRVIETYCNIDYKLYGENPHVFFDYYSQYIKPFLNTDIWNEKEKCWLNNNWKWLNKIEINKYIFLKKVLIRWKKKKI